MTRGGPDDTRICFMMPHFGKWPRWLPIFLETCRRNPTVDWHFVTDCDPPANSPANVRYQRCSLPELKELISEKLGVAVSLGYPFKVCDFRPAFGVIFDEVLADYDFWGWGDTDVVLGNLRAVLPEHLLSKYDFISARSGFLSGEFTLVRNSPQCNRLYEQSADHQTIFTTACGYDFEEYGFFENRKIDSMTHVVKRMVKSGTLRCLMDDLGRNDRKLKSQRFCFYWHDGDLIDTYTGDPILLYHFLDLKRDSAFSVPEAPLDYSNGVLITREGFRPAESVQAIQRRPIRSIASRTRRAIRRLRASL